MTTGVQTCQIHSSLSAFWHAVHWTLMRLPARSWPSGCQLHVVCSDCAQSGTVGPPSPTPDSDFCRLQYKMNEYKNISLQFNLLRPLLKKLSPSFSSLANSYKSKSILIFPKLKAFIKKNNFSLSRSITCSFHQLSWTITFFFPLQLCLAEWPLRSSLFIFIAIIRSICFTLLLCIQTLLCNMSCCCSLV